MPACALRAEVEDRERGRSRPILAAGCGIRAR
jgi:hypothetical protein